MGKYQKQTCIILHLQLPCKFWMTLSGDDVQTGISFLTRSYPWNHILNPYHLGLSIHFITLEALIAVKKLVKSKTKIFRFWCVWDIVTTSVVYYCSFRSALLMVAIKVNICHARISNRPNNLIRPSTVFRNTLSSIRCINYWVLAKRWYVDRDVPFEAR